MISSSVDNALSGPFDNLRSAGLSAAPALCECTNYRYLHVVGLFL